MRTGHAIEVRVLCNDGQAVGDGGGRDEGVGQPNGSMDARTAAVVDEVSPSGHHRLADRNGICLSSQSERIGTLRSDVVVICGKHTQFQLAESDNRHRDPVREAAERPSDSAAMKIPVSSSPALTCQRPLLLTLVLVATSLRSWVVPDRDAQSASV